MAELAAVKKAENILINLDLPYKMSEIEKTKGLKEPKFVTAFMIRHAVSMKYKESMPRDTSRVFALVSDELLAEPKTLSLSKTEFNFLFEWVNGCDYPAELSSWRWTLVDYLEELKRKQA